MIITLSGHSGSGKSSTGRMLAKKLGYKFYSIGDLRGKMAMEKGLTIDQLNEIGKREEWTDRDPDKFQEKLGREEDDFVMDSWVGFHFIPHSVKVFLKVDPKIAAERIFRDQRPDEARQRTEADVREMIEKRMKESRARYRKYYNVDIYDMKNYDLVIDTTKIHKDEVIEKIMEFLRKKRLISGRN